MSASRNYTQNRELSWLSFNERVLQMGRDESTPLMERLKFIAIYQSNLSEFFMIRVGGLHDLSLLKKDVVDNKSNMTAAQQLAAVYERCKPLEKMRDKAFSEVEGLLAEHGIRRRTWGDLSDEQRSFVEAYAKKLILPVLSPQMIYSRHPFPHLQNEELYVVCRLEIPQDVAAAFDALEGEGEAASASASAPSGSASSSSASASAASASAASKDAGGKKGKGKASKKKHEVERISRQPFTVGIVALPPSVDRMIMLPAPQGGIEFILAEDVVAHYAPEVFDVYKTSEVAVVCVTRNADIDPDDEAYDDDDDYRQHMKKILKKRKRLAPVRICVQGHLGTRMSAYLLRELELSAEQVFEIKSPIDLSYVYRLEDMLSDEQRSELCYTPYSPVFPASLDAHRPMLDQVRERDVLLSYPYDSVEPFLMMLKEAAADPCVVSIKITLYRLARLSKVAEHLIAAAENGKSVLIILELRARFDEQNNIEWAERFEEAGCAVLYGFEGYKVHSKICQIVRKSGETVEIFTQLATGNYNEKTARQYTDLSLMTADPGIGMDGATFFNNMAMGNLDGEYSELWVSPTSLKPSLLEAMDSEIEKARNGQAARIAVKCNSVTDLDLIDKIAEASQAGVQVELIVRGICCILPGVVGSTDNVEVVSIVGRFLEHSRVYCIGAGDDPLVYLSSADMMTRNTERRVEIAFPVKDAAGKARVLDMLATQLSDTARARCMQPDGSYLPIPTQEGCDPLDAQAHFMQAGEGADGEGAAGAGGGASGGADEDATAADGQASGPGFFARFKMAFRLLFFREMPQDASREPKGLIGPGDDID